MKLQRASILAVGLLLLVVSPALARKWTDNTGMYSVEAELVEVRGDKVVLKKTTGSVVTMPIARLSMADREYLKSLSKPGPNQAATVGRRAIEAALEKRHDFTIRQMPLREAIQHLLEPEQIPYYVNWPALADELGVRGEEPVDFAAKGIVVGEAVNKLLGSLEIGWLIRDEVLYITGPVDSEMPRNSEPVVYRTRSSRVRAGALAKGIRSKVFPSSWDTAGGPGRMTVFGDRVVVIFQIAAVHRGILRRYGKTIEPVYEARGRAFERPPGTALSPTQVIRQVTKCDFQNVPLKEAVAELQTAHGLKIEFDKTALDDWGIAVDSRVTLQLTGVRLESALNLLTEQVDMGWFMEGERLTITHRVGAQEKLWNIDYDVGDLVEVSGEDSLSSIAAAIRTTVRPPLGRRAVVRPDPVQATGAGILRVRACFADHCRIGRLLEDIRTACGPIPTEGDRQ